MKEVLYNASFMNHIIPLVCTTGGTKKKQSKRLRQFDVLSNPENITLLADFYAQLDSLRKPSFLSAPAMGLRTYDAFLSRRGAMRFPQLLRQWTEQ